MQKLFFRFATFIIAVLLVSSMGVLVANSADGEWQASYYNNTTLSGKPVLTNTAQAVDFNWGTKSPGTGVNADNFSVRWTKTTTMPAGRYRLTLTSDDGSRAFVNNRLVTNQWWEHPLRTASGEYTHSGGTMNLRVEFFEAKDKAVVSFKMERIGDAPAAATATPRATANPANLPSLNSCSTTGWFGNYWNNAFLAGAPARSQTVGHINFNWGEGAPIQGLNRDHWSASWTNTINLAPGNYQFTITSDDGSSLWVNNVQFLNLWYNHTTLTRSRVLNHPGGPVTLRIEYYDNEGPANMSFACARLADANPVPTSTTAPTAVPQPTATPDPLLTANAGQCVISNVYAINLRSAPSTSSAIVTVLSRGDITTRTGNRSGAWVQIRTAANQIGWVNGYYCGSGQVPRSSTTQSASTINHVCAVEVDALLIRTGPSTGYPHIDVAFRGEQLRLTGQRNAAGTWVSVITPDGSRGWVYAPYIGVPANVLQQLTITGG